jgi:hypothetical protein
MIINVTAKGYYEIINWLKIKVGPMIWTKHVMESLGHEWHVVSNYSEDRGSKQELSYCVTIDNPRIALMFVLWAS